MPPFQGNVNEEWQAECGRDYDVEQCLAAFRKCQTLELLPTRKDKLNGTDENAMRNVAIARKAIIDVLDDNPGNGKMPCPVCHSGTLCYSKASNGHVSGFCTSKNCVIWME